MNGNTYTTNEVADLVECDAQTLRAQVKSDIAQGRNSQNFNAFQVGNTLRFPKRWLDRKLGIGPVLTVSAQLADVLIKLGMAKEEDDEAVHI